MISRDQCERLCAILIGFISDKAPANIAEFEDYYGSMFPNVCSMMLGNKELDEEEQSYIHDKVRDSISFPLRESKTIASENVLNDRWLNELDIDFRYSDRYFSYLISKKNRDCNSIDILKKDSLRIIQMLGNPNIDKTQHRKGLMIGDVQSGKTESYTAVLNRAVDAGYDVNYGARPLKREVSKTVESLLAHELVKGTIKYGETVTFDVKDNQLVIKK